MIKKFMTKYNREKIEQQLWDHIAQEYDKKDKILYSRLARKLRLKRTLRNIPKPINNILEYLNCLILFYI